MYSVMRKVTLDSVIGNFFSSAGKFHVTGNVSSLVPANRGKKCSIYQKNYGGVTFDMLLVLFHVLIRYLGLCCWHVFRNCGSGRYCHICTSYFGIDFYNHHIYRHHPPRLHCHLRPRFCHTFLSFLLVFVAIFFLVFPAISSAFLKKMIIENVIVGLWLIFMNSFGILRLTTWLRHTIMWQERVIQSAVSVML